MSSNYPPGVTGSEDYFQDDEEMTRRKKRHKHEDRKGFAEAAKISLEEAEYLSRMALAALPEEGK